VSDGGDKANGFYPIRGPLTSSVDQRILNMSSDEKGREYGSGRIDKGVGDVGSNISSAPASDCIDGAIEEAGSLSEARLLVLRSSVLETWTLPGSLENPR
jgi:hypothetical protein